MRTSAELFENTRKTVPDDLATLDFLRAHKLMPAEVATSAEGLLSGLLHFAEVTPAVQLAVQDLITFAYYAQAALDNQNAELLARTIAERVEEAIGSRIDAYTEKMGKGVRAASGGIGKVKADVEDGVQQLREVCERLEEAGKAAGELQCT